MQIGGQTASMVHYDGKSLLTFLTATIFLLPCEGFYSYRGVRYSYGCTGWFYMGSTVKWKYGLDLQAPFVGLTYPCESDACEQQDGFCKPSVCGEPCEYFCDEEHTFYNLKILDNGVEVPIADAECVSAPCKNPGNGNASMFCQNYKLKPSIQKKYVLHLEVNITKEDDDKPMRNEDADMYIVAGDVDVEKCTGYWANGDQIKTGSEGHFIIQLMDSFGNKVGAETGRDGAALDVDLEPGITAGSSGDRASLTDLVCNKIGDTGTYNVTFMTHSDGDFNLNIYAFVSRLEYFTIQGSPFPFKVVSGGVDVPSCTGSWVNGGPINVGESVILRVVQKDISKQAWSADDYAFKAEVTRALGSARNFTPPVINSYKTVDSPGSQDFVVQMESTGDFLLKIMSEVGDEQIEGSPFSFRVKAGELVFGSTTASWAGGVNTFSAGSEAFLRILAVDKDGNYIDPLPAGEIICTIEKLGTDNRALPDIPITIGPEIGDNGYQLLTFTPQLIGEFVIKITMSNGTAIPGSPFTFTVIVGLPSAMKSTGAWLDGLDKFIVGEKATFVITLLDAYGNNVTTAGRGGSRLGGCSWNISIIDQANPTVPLTYPVSLGAPTDEGTQFLTFSPTATGTFFLRVYTSTDLQGSPFIFQVRAGDPAMSYCTASWSDATTNPPQYTAGSHPKMKVTQKDAEKNLYLDLFPFTLEVDAIPPSTALPVSPLNISNPVNGLTTEEGPNLSQGEVIVTFEAVASGKFQLHIGNGETEILGSPFMFIVLPGPLAIGNTTGGWANNTVQFNLGDKVLFLITQRDIYGNPATQDKNNLTAGTAYFSAKAFQVGENRTDFQLSELTISPIGDSIWTQEKLQFTVTQPGNFELEVYVSANKFYLAKYWYYFQEDAGMQIMGSPFTFFVGGGEVYAPACNASGPGLAGGAAGDILKFTIYTYTKNLVASPVPTSYFKVEFNPETDANPVLKQGNSNAINVQYRIIVASEPSGYAMTVKAATTSEEIQGSPFKVNITTGPLVIQNCIGHFKGGNPAIPIGRTAIFIIYQQDAFGNKIYTNSWGVHDYIVKIRKDDQSPVILDIRLTPSVSDKDQMLIMFNITRVGNYTLQVGDSSGSIQGSPFAFSVVQGAVITADQCKAQFVPGQDLEVGIYLNIVITSYDATGEPKKSQDTLEFDVTSVPPMLGTPNPVRPKDLSNGTYIATIKITSAGFISFMIDLFGEAIPGSPFEFEVEAGTTLPRAEYDDVWTWMNYPLTFNVLRNDYVKIGSPIFVRIDSPKNGDMSIGQDGTMVYTPDKDYAGSEYLTYEMKDETGEIALGEVSITVSPLGQPYISAFPRMLLAFEDEPLPAIGGLANMEVASLEPDTVLSVVLFALHGRMYPAAEMSAPWSNVSVIIPNDSFASPENATKNVTMEEQSEKIGVQLKITDETTTSNKDSNALRFSARLENLNAALKALQYVGLENFNGNDSVYFTVLNPAGVGCTKSMSIYVKAVNDPPFVVAPSVFTINLSSSEAFGLDLLEVGTPIKEITVGDPDADDTSGILQVESGQIQITIPPSGYISASYRIPGEKNWSVIPENQIMVWGQGVRFEASILDWNTALQGIMFRSDNASSQRIELSLLVDDLGKFGCVGDCTNRDSYSYVTQHQMTIMIYAKGYKPPYKLKASVKSMLYAMGAIAGMLGILYLAGKGGRGRTLPWRRGRPLLEFEEGEENYKMIRVYNPLWIPTYQKAEIPTGIGFEVQQNWKMETMVASETGPPLGNESTPLEFQWSPDGSSQLQPLPGDHFHGGDRGVRARKFSVKWSANSGAQPSATLGGTQDGSIMVGLGESQPLGSPPPPFGAFANVPFGNEGGALLPFGDIVPSPPPPGDGAPLLWSEPPLWVESPFTGFGEGSGDDPFTTAFSGFGDSGPPAPPPSVTPDASFAFEQKHVTGFGDELPTPPPHFGGPPTADILGATAPPPPPDPIFVSFEIPSPPP